MDINRSVEEAKIRDISLVDVRTPEEYRHGHIPGAINIPLNTTSKVQLDPEKEYFAYCHSGRRSELASRILNERGFHVENIGGIDDWVKEIEN